MKMIKPICLTHAKTSHRPHHTASSTHFLTMVFSMDFRSVSEAAAADSAPSPAGVSWTQRISPWPSTLLSLRLHSAHTLPGLPADAPDGGDRG